MGRKVRPALDGLDALGARLRQLRVQSGLSQMKLARLIGFDPAHGYKYVLRLEKGQVPNPTLRTIASCLEACGETWQAVVDVLPRTGAISSPITAQLSADNRKPGVASATPVAPQPASENLATEVPHPPRRKDSRPMREQLRSRRIEQRELRHRRFWSGARQADEATAALLHSLRVPSNLRRSYLSFTRACCSTIDVLVEARPEVVERELARLIPPAISQGLDRAVLAQIQSACRQIFRSQLPTENRATQG